MVLHALRTFTCFFHVLGTALSSHIFRLEIFDQIQENADYSIAPIMQVSALSEFDCLRRCSSIVHYAVTSYSKRGSLCELYKLSKHLNNEYIDKTNGWVMWFRRCSLLTEDNGKLATAPVNIYNQCKTNLKNCHCQIFVNLSNYEITPPISEAKI